MFNPGPAGGTVRASGTGEGNIPYHRSGPCRAFPARRGNSGSDPAAKYWEATKGLYAALNGANTEELPVSEEDLYKVVRIAAPVLISIPEGGGEPDTELLTDVIGYNRELTYSHLFDTIIARLKVLAPAPEK